MLNFVVEGRLWDLRKGWEVKGVKHSGKISGVVRDVAGRTAKVESNTEKGPSGEAGERPGPLQKMCGLPHDANSKTVQTRNHVGVPPWILRHYLQYLERPLRRFIGTAHSRQFFKALFYVNSTTFSSFGNSFAHRGILTPGLLCFPLLWHYFLLLPYLLYSFDYRSKARVMITVVLGEMKPLLFFTLEIKNIFLQNTILVYSKLNGNKHNFVNQQLPWLLP